jgi:hypothetical protein
MKLTFYVASAALLISLGSSEAKPRTDRTVHVLMNRSDDGPCGWILGDGMMGWRAASCAEIRVAQDPETREWFEK